MPDATVLSFLPLAHRLADAARAAIAPYYRQPFTTDWKADASPVTLADRAAERAIRALLEVECPAHGIIGEEEGSLRADAEWLWVIDPIDGTKNFLSGTPLFTTLIGLCRHGHPVLGVIDQTVLQERWIGGESLPTTLNGLAVNPSTTSSLPRARLSTTAPECFTASGWQQFQHLRNVVGSATYGKDAYAYALLATGQLDLVMEEGLQPHDYAALLPVLQAAGAIVTDWQGNPLTLQGKANLLAAATPELHQAALAAIG